MEYKVTAYCLAYNHEKYVRQALEGFVSQKTDFGFKVIVHDDASTDGTRDLKRDFPKETFLIICKDNSDRAVQLCFI